MSAKAARNDLTLETIQCSKERDRPVPVIIMGPSLDVTGSKRQTGLRTAQGPNLALLIGSKRLVWWVEIQSDDVPKFRLEFRISGQFESPAGDEASDRCWPKVSALSTY